MRHRIEIDGLRAFAILPVLLFHAEFPLINGGFLGVDIFFVISGFLITGIILNELDTKNSFSIVNFYERRIRRLFPALFIVSVVTTVLAWFILFSDEYDVFRASVRWLTFFASNIFFFGQNDYFDPNIDLNPMLHTWSLAVEEQFYIFFPLVLWLLWKFIPRRIWLGILAAVTLLSLLSAEMNWHSDQSETFYLLQFRAWELLAGAMVAIYLSKRGNHNFSRNWPSALAITVLLISFFEVDQTMPHPGLITAIPVLATIAILLFAGQGTVAYAILSNKVIVWVGLISYSAYLWHQPLFALYRSYRNTDPEVWEFIPIIAFVLFISHLTWKYVENPFRDKAAFTRKKLLLLAPIATVALLASTVLLKTPYLDTQVFASPTKNGAETQSAQEITGRLIENYGLGKICKDFLESPESCTSSSGKGLPTVALWGDSFAMHLAGALSTSATQEKFIQQTISACSPVLGLSPQNIASNLDYGKKCIESNQDFFNALVKSEIDTVVLASNWKNIFDAEARVLQGGGNVSKSRNLGEKSLNGVIGGLKNAGKRVVVVLGPPYSGKEFGNCIRRSIVFGAKLTDCDFKLEENLSDQINEKVRFASSKADLVIDPKDLVCANTVCQVTKEGVFIYRDHYHLSIEGSEAVGEKHDLMGMITGKLNQPTY